MLATVKWLGTFCIIMWLFGGFFHWRVDGNMTTIEADFKELEVEYSVDAGHSWVTLSGDLYHVPGSQLLMRTK